MFNLKTALKYTTKYTSIRRKEILLMINIVVEAAAVKILNYTRENWKKNAISIRVN